MISVRLLGSLIGATVASSGALIQILAGVPIRANEPFTLVLPLGIPIAAILGARHAPAAAQRPTTHLRIAIAFATQAIAFGSLSVSSIAILASQWGEMIGRTSALDTVGGVLTSAAVGLLLLGIPLFPAITALAFAWALLVRRVATR